MVEADRGKDASTIMHERMLGKSDSTSGKRASPFNPAAQPPIQSQPRCPQCGGDRVYKDGLRRLWDGNTVQRFLCRRCGYRFSEKVPQGPTQPLQKRLGMSQHIERIETQSLNSELAVPSTYQVCAALARGAKNLSATEIKTVAGEESQTRQDAKGKIIDYLWYLKKKGRLEITLDSVNGRLNQLSRNVDLLDPEAVKDFLSTQDKWSNRTKAIDASIYAGFLKFHRIPWEPPEYKPERKPVFIPTKEELDQLISGTGKRLSVFLQLLEETGMRYGEAAKLKWTDIDFQRRLVPVTTEKGGNPRILPISNRMLEMLSNLKKRAERIFDATDSSISSNYYQQRLKLARKLGNPRLLKIGFHTFRHWKLTMVAHEFRDPFYVQEFAGHRDIKSTMLYIHLEKQLYQKGAAEEFHVATAKTVEDASKLVASGWEFVHEYQEVMIYRKRK